MLVVVVTSRVALIALDILFAFLWASLRIIILLSYGVFSVPEGEELPETLQSVYG